ncbi:MAG: LysE family transporter [Gammaproteobacteria bacterium]|nr:LysE family transporter [Gammaproteobacteria bacterium]
MTELFLLLKGCLIGLAIAAPIGPMSILCMQRTLHENFRLGFLTGIGIALADGTYGLVAGLGITAISNFLIHYHLWITRLGGLFLIYLGIKFMLLPSILKLKPNKSALSSLHACTTAYALTITNPSTIIIFTAIFAGLGIGTIHTSITHALSLVLGIILGSTSWWLAFCTGLVLIRKKLNPKIIKIINVISGFVLMGFGIVSLF